MFEHLGKGARIKLAHRLRYDPEFYVKRVLRARPSVQQRRVLARLRERLAENEKLEDSGEPPKAIRFAIKSGHGTGKTTLFGWLIHWFLNTRPDALIPCTAPKADQLKDGIWREILIWNARAVAPFCNTVEVTDDEIRMRESPKTWKAVARTARKDNPEALQGFHAKHLMAIVEEASGVDDKIFEAGRGMFSTPGVLAFLIGNPTRTSGMFHRAFHSLRHKWECFTFSWEELVGTNADYVDPDYGPDVAEEYGKDSDVYRVRVAGEFPRDDSDSLIPLDWVEASVEREIEPTMDDPMIFGVDVGYTGDESVCVMRRGGKVYDVEAWRGFDTHQTAVRVHHLYKEHVPHAIFVDTVGIGRGVADQLSRMVPKGVVQDVNVGESAANNDDFVRLRDELWWKLRKDFEQKRISLPDDERLTGQLSTINKSTTADSRIRVETKAERKKRLGGKKGASPDRADALMLTYASEVRGVQRTAKDIARWLRQAKKQAFSQPSSQAWGM